MSITVFTKNNCMKCMLTKRFLEEHQIDFEEKNISKETQYVDFLKNKGFMETPVVFVKNEDGEDSFSGFRPDKLNQLVKLSV
ncbi:NrdH-redoxin [Philodulcilactobacillus myokoensis]|uniref:Glutaredoxin-like protein NrdH n=1 Tax=Philodulcilactobacillus myokoensis TaxID=2929573 RepID=A0A9W6ESK9_9LACO|nr:glutaredoxin-like protein NrdH [Philodulcilactobacillus myokoensis]GLB47166.1 NrdH-redoxin [Philodulcilactobacillus myokoensis]